MIQRYNLDTDKHRGNRSVLRIIGPIVFAIGLVLTLIGVGSFFLSFGSGSGFGGVRLVFLAVIGIPIMGVGSMITKFAYFGAVARYIASEAAPVAKDTTNYMIDGTKDAVGDLAQSVGAGIAAGMAGDRPAGDMVNCPSCDEACDSGARFCSNCGTAIPGEVRCDRCAAMNEPDAKFCDQCGQSTGV